MYFEQIAKVTADHLRLHLPTYLSQISQEFAGLDIVTLQPPNDISVDSLVGGVFAVPLENLPVYAVDALNKQPDPTIIDLYTYLYDGHIVGMVTANSAHDVDRQIKRHEWAVEQYVREHLFLHQLSGEHFTILGLEFIGSQFSGAEMAEDNEDTTLQVWVDAFVINVRWTVSEDGPIQHA